MSKQLPQNPSIRFAKIEAKKMLKEFQQGNLSQCQPLRLIKRFASLSDDELLNFPVKLHDVQYALALEHGFESWQQLSDHCIEEKQENNGIINMVIRYLNGQLRKWDPCRYILAERLTIMAWIYLRIQLRQALRIGSELKGTGVYPEGAIGMVKKL